jgi:hypothetical protein
MLGFYEKPFELFSEKTTSFIREAGNVVEEKRKAFPFFVEKEAAVQEVEKGDRNHPAGDRNPSVKAPVPHFP